MKLAITGTPGTGKTVLSKNLAKLLNCEVINEKDFAIKNKIGFFNDENELEIPIKEFEKKANLFLSKKKNIILEGHVLCEAKLAVDKIIVLYLAPEKLEFRLEQRNYSTQKVMDNVFCEGIDYCKKNAGRNYSKSKIILLNTESSPKTTLLNAVKCLNLPKTAK